MGRTRTGVTKASDTTIQITFTYQGKLCRERLKLEPTAANLKRAANHRAAILDAIDRGTFVYAETFPDSKRAAEFSPIEPGGVLLRDFLTTWVAGKERQLKASTRLTYRRIVSNILIPVLGHHTVEGLKRSHVKEWLTGLDVSNKRLANLQSVLRAALDDAMIDEIVEVNILAGWAYKVRDGRKKTSDVDPFSVAEQKAILDHAEGQFANLIRFAIWTGMRTSELVALTWADVDWVGGTVRVDKAKTEASTEVEEPKTEAGDRDVKLLGPALEALVAQKPFTFMKDREIFEDPRYLEPWKGDEAIREKFWRPLLKRAGVRYRRPYQTRHTFASMMLSSGEPPRWVATQLGHSDLMMLFRTYGKWIPDADPDVGQRGVRKFATGE